jgi:hypothetical protein
MTNRAALKRLRMNPLQWLVTRYYGIKISEDGMRWTAPYKHAAMVEKAFARVSDQMWRESGLDVKAIHTPEGMEIACPNGRITLRWLP